jgi:hypothetical protein
VTATQGFFQQLATGTTSGTDDCDVAHDVSPVGLGESVLIWFAPIIVARGLAPVRLRSSRKTCAYGAAERM